ncbi:Cbb3-type cytochrome c oxidase subunit CcoN1 [Gammaproteobacteria bacterium]
MDTQNTYNYTVVRQFAVMALAWGIIGMAIGVWIASELAFPSLNFDIPWLTFSRLRPLHTNIVIFAFAGNVLFATSYYVAQHTCQTRLFGPSLATFTFWGWQFAMVLAVFTLPSGMSSGKEYAELEWPIDILIAVVWVIYAIVFFGTLTRRKTPQIYVTNWFHGAYILAFAMLHLINSAELPVSFWPMKSYSLYPGAVDAMVAWWYGHNFVGLFITVAFLGTMYYFLPKQIERPIYSYRLAVVHFFAIITFAAWSAPQHLLYSALPDWTQSLGMVFSVLLLLPLWGGLINGLMTMSGCWNKMLTDPVLRFIVGALLFYGISTLEGSIMAIKTVNAFIHYTDLAVGHAHSGGFGWIGFLSIGVLYILLPQIFHHERMYSIRLIIAHFWFAILGVALYLVAMGYSGIMQDKMWRAMNDDGTLTYRFVESVQAIHYLYILRAIGGLLYLIGMFLMAYNVWKTIHVSRERVCHGHGHGHRHPAKSSHSAHPAHTEHSDHGRHAHSAASSHAHDINHSTPSGHH